MSFTNDTVERTRLRSRRFSNRSGARLSAISTLLQETGAYQITDGQGHYVGRRVVDINDKPGFGVEINWDYAKRYAA